MEQMPQEGRLRRGTHTALVNFQAPLYNVTTHEEMRMTQQHGPEIIISAEESIERDCLVCMFDGHKTKFLPRYVKSQYGMDWDNYLEYCGLPPEYPRQPTGYAADKELLSIMTLGLAPGRR